jgi:hypothetical protein
VNGDNPKVQLRFQCNDLIASQTNAHEALANAAVSDAAIASDRRTGFSWLEGVCGWEKMARCLAVEQPHTIWALARADRQEFRRAE